ncbi:SDR family oxidoreductase [Rhizobium mayense]|uniref:SDR family oxidoreductase n=1 Tax=Rhizobium mayense TaxID=1312184 RepID=A0ABT7K562_9HYPH|nr:SDR family oxidoreductase [Rhizobium mayense]MDL2403646.1 SDR family oxidoreductase [Rhizobium mayense]
MIETVLVAGASRGIGLELVRQYAEMGYRVIAGCRNPATAGALTSLKSNGNIAIHGLDTSSDESVARFSTNVGDQPIDIAIVSAGVAGGDRQSFGAIDFIDLAATLNINTAGPLRLAQALASNLSKAQQGKLVAITSEMGSIEQTSSSFMMAYRISKAALNEAWKCVAVEMREADVTAMVIHPGWVATDMGGREAPVSPEVCVQGIRKVIDQLRLEDAGTFRTYDGEFLPW